MTTNNVVLAKLVAPITLSAMTEYLKGTLGSQLSADDIGGEFKIVRKRDGVTVFASDTKNFTNRWACFLSNATNPKVPFEQRGTTENIINEKGSLKTQEEIKERYEMVVTSWAPSSDFPSRRPNGEKKEAPKVLGILETLKLAQEKLNTELATLREQQEQLSQMVAAKEKEIRKGARAIEFYSAEEDDETDEGLV